MAWRGLLRLIIPSVVVNVRRLIRSKERGNSDVSAQKVLQARKQHLISTLCFTKVSQHTSTASDLPPGSR